MKINSLNSQVPFNRETKPQAKLEQKESTIKDSFTLSNEAKLIKASFVNKDLNAIKEKIANGFYNSNKVISEVAGKILKEIGE